MEEPKYGLVSDIDKFVETDGKEGIDKPVDPPTEPTKPVNPPTEPTKPVDPPTEPTKPVDPPTEPTKPVDPPTEPTKPVEPIKVTETKEYKELEDKIKAFEDKKINPKLKEIQDWSDRTGRPIEDWPKYQVDVEGMSDSQVLRETQRRENPTLTEAELDFYISDNFISEDIDTDEDKMRKSIALKKAVKTGRDNLEKDRLVFDTQTDATLTAEQKTELEFATKMRESLKDSDADDKLRNAAISKTIDEVDKISFKIGEDVSLDYNIPTESKTDQSDYLSKGDRWKNDDGSTDYKTFLEDSYKLRHFDDILKIVYDQGQNDKLEAMARDSSGVTPPKKVGTPDPIGSKYGLVGERRQVRRQV